jgi:hypothetical protein
MRWVLEDQDVVAEQARGAEPASRRSDVKGDA